MSTVSISILSADFCKLKEDCAMTLEAGAKMLHYDVMDGHFVPNISFGVPVLASLYKGLPHAFYDVHLMISHPIDYIEPFAKAGASLLNFHIECEDDVSEVLNEIQEFNCLSGLTIKPATPVDALLPYLDRVDLVLVMSVEPGFGGQSFQWEALEKVKELNALRDANGYSYMIEIDGGVDEKTGPACVDAGADVLVTGSAVFHAQDAASVVKNLAAL